MGGLPWITLRAVREALYEAAHIIVTKPIKGCAGSKILTEPLLRRSLELCSKIQNVGGTYISDMCQAAIALAGTRKDLPWWIGETPQRKSGET